MNNEAKAALVRAGLLIIAIIAFMCFSTGGAFAQTYTVSARVVNNATTATASRLISTATIEAKQIKQWPRASRPDSLTESGLYQSWVLNISGGVPNSQLPIRHGAAIVLPNKTIILDGSGNGYVYVDVRTDVQGDPDVIYTVGFAY